MRVRRPVVALVSATLPVIFVPIVPVWKVALLASIVPPVMAPPAKTSVLAIVRLFRSSVPPERVMVLVPKAVAEPVTSVPAETMVAPV